MVRTRPLFTALLLSLLIFILPSAGTSPALAQGDSCGGVASRLVAGELARVSVDPGQTLRLRSAPGLSAATSARLNRGEILIVVEGPVCADGYPWWQLQTAEGLPGWAAEGSGSAYFLEPVAPEEVTPTPVPPTATPSATATLTSTATATSTPSATITPSVTPSVTPTMTHTLTATVTLTITPSPTDTPSATPLPPTATITPSPTLTLTATPSPTLPTFPTVAPSATLDSLCWTAPRPRLSVGDDARVTSAAQGLRLRSLPAVGTGQERLLRPGTAFTVTEGPLCNTGYTWYQVMLADGSSGWLAEGEGTTYWVEPAAAEPLPLAEQACLAWADNEGLHLTRGGTTIDLAGAASQRANTLSLSPNGRFLAALQGRSLTLYDLDRDELLVTSQSSDSIPASIAGWLPDSSAVLLNSQGADAAPAIWQVSLYGTREQLPLEGWQAAAPAPGDRLYLALIRPTGWGAAVYDLSSGVLLSEYAPDPPRTGTPEPAAVTWLPDGRLLATFSTLSRSGERAIAAIATFDPAAGAFSPLDTGALALNQLDWGTSGSPIVYTLTSGGLWTASEIGEMGTLLLPLRPGDADGLAFSLSPSGGMVLYQNLFEPGAPAALIDLNTGETTRLVLPDDESVWQFGWLEGDTLLLATDNASSALVNQPTNEAFWLLDTASGELTRLLALENTIFGAYTLSPDGCALPGR